MDRSALKRGRRDLLARASLGLVVCGIALSVWALWNMAGESSSVKEPQTVGESWSSTESFPSARTETDATRTADASRAAGTTQGAYPANPKTGDVFGRLSIPRLEQTFPLVQGTGDDELKRGVGHMVRTAMPGEADNCVISGHRDTVFTGLGKVKKDDLLIVETAAGTFTYRVVGIRIVDKDDRTVVVHTDRAVLTVSTCYPFRYVGSAPDRYVLIADLVTNP